MVTLVLCCEPQKRSVCPMRTQTLVAPGKAAIGSIDEHCRAIFHGHGGGGGGVEN